MSIYRKWELDKSELIELATSFNKMRRLANTTSISYQKFSEYYEKYFDEVIKNALGFDYITYGYLLLNAKVITSKKEKEIFDKKRLVLSNFLATYIIKSELNKIINPNEIYIESQLKK